MKNLVLAVLTVGIGISQAATSQTSPRSAAVADSAFFEWEVTTAAQLIPPVPHPGYPARLQSADVKGTVLARWVVDTNGVLLPGSIRILRSPHKELSDSVLAVIERIEFVPARIRERKVRQVVQVPFQFRP